MDSFAFSRRPRREFWMIKVEFQLKVQISLTWLKCCGFNWIFKVILG